MPFGPYTDFNDCTTKNGDKANPEAFCAWLHHKILGTWPSGMSADKYPEPFLKAYDAALVAGKPDKEAYAAAEEAAKADGFELTRFGWVKQFQAPKMKTITGVKVFAAGTWTDSAGVEKTWTTEDLDKMVEAFTAGVPLVVPAKCGHTSDEFNQRIAEALDVPVEVITGDHGQGQIKLGSMISLQRKGDLLIAAFDKIPEAIASLIEGGQYSTVSCEIEDAIGDFGPVITGVALLGAEEPAVDKATLERALVFGGSRKGARVLSFTMGDDIPTLKSKLKAAFAGIGELVDKLVGKADHAPDGDKDPAALLKGKPSNNSGKPGGNGPNPASRNASDEGDNQANKIKQGGKHQMDELKKIAASLGLPETATVEEILAAIKALADGVAAAALPPESEAEALAKAKADAEGGEMTAELKKANDRIAALEGQVAGQSSLAAWKEKTAKFTSIPGTAAEHAVKLAAIEGKAGKETADAQFAALESANNLAAEALKVVGTSRKGDPTDFDNEVAKYQTANPTASKADAIKAVSKARPDLYFARK